MIKFIFFYLINLKKNINLKKIIKITAISKNTLFTTDKSYGLADFKLLVDKRNNNETTYFLSD
jgi:hypothetical protein